jgi:RimJ/RimL family protein N-acetyltransferase
LAEDRKGINKNKGRLGIMKVLETERLFLRKLEVSDSSKLALVLSDPDSMVHYPHAFSDEEVKGWIERNIQRYTDTGFGLWAVIRKYDNEFLGDCGITMQNIDGEILPEIGFHIIKKYCGMGYGTESAYSCLKYANEKPGFKAIYSYTRKTNIASQRVCLKIGMMVKKTYLKDGIEHIVFEYSFY